MSGEASGPAPLEVVVPTALDGERLDRTLSFLCEVSRAAATGLIADGLVTLDGLVATHRAAPVSAGARLVVHGLGSGLGALEADPGVSFGVVFEDDDLIVVDKPWDLVVHPGAGRRTGTLANGLLARYPELAGLVAEGLSAPERPGIVHRLDRGTSGLLVVARSARSVSSLSAQMAAHAADRRYAALVHGHTEHDRGVVDAPVGRSVRRPSLMTVSAAGREARTGYEVLQRYDEPLASTLLTASLETGRTHQIRVHMAAIGHPVVGDTRYRGGGGPRPKGLPSGRFFLHAYALNFEHPGGGPATFRSPLPDDLVAMLGERPVLPGEGR
jgi:23S rRNA pseudouridine1911/1915/1917 synthase